MSAPACPLCGSTGSKHHARAHDIEYFTSLGQFDFWRCEPCDILHISPMLTDRLGDLYPANYYSFSGKAEGLVQRVKTRLDRALFRTLCAGVRGDTLSALDVGGGSGWLLDLLKQADARVTRTCVADIDAGAQARANAAGHAFALGPFETFQPAEPFDIILMLNLIEHVPDPAAAMAHARSMLKAGGRILIKTPNFDALDARLFRNASWAGYHTPRHFVLFTRGSIEAVCRKAGLRVVEFRYAQGAPFWSISVFDMLRRAGLVSASAERPAIYHPLVPLLQAGFAAFDLLRRPFGKLSQMELILARDDDADHRAG